MEITLPSSILTSHVRTGGCLFFVGTYHRHCAFYLSKGSNRLQMFGEPRLSRRGGGFETQINPTQGESGSPRIEEGSQRGREWGGRARGVGGVAIALVANSAPETCNRLSMSRQSHEPLPVRHRR